MKNIMIVEDEPELAENLKEILEHLNYRVTNVFTNSTDVLHALITDTPDLILMDILIEGEMDGVDLAYHIRDKYQVPLIFITAYHDSAMLDRVSKVNYDGYLLKPYTVERLESSIYLALKNFESQINGNEKIKTLKIRDKGFLVPVPEDDVIYLKADGLYTRVFTVSKNYIIRDILKDVIGDLSQKKFLRVHKSFTVNIKYITSFNSKELTLGDYVIPIRRGLFKDLKDLIANN
jgi:two-component system, LytTR family, response regulator LytT